MPHVKRDDMPRATFEEHLCESTGRGTNIEDESRVWIDGETVQRGQKFVRRPTDIVVRHGDLDDLVVTD